jgi:guanylate kinase
VVRSVSHTTRAPRPGETDGADYHFTDRERFQQMVAADDFLEHAEVFGNLYGTSRSAVERELAAGRDVILVIDWQGAANVKKLLPDAVSVFIVPPSLSALRERLSGRGQDDADVIAGRLAEARDDIGHYQGFDYLVVNDVFEDAAADLRHIVIAQRLAGAQQAVRQQALLAELLGH